MCKIREMIRKAKSVLESKVGEGYIDTAVKMIIAVVIGGLLLTGFYQLINGVVLPEYHNDLAFLSCMPRG